MTGRVAGKVAFITGAVRGQGRSRAVPFSAAAGVDGQTDIADVHAPVVDHLGLVVPVGAEHVTISSGWWRVRARTSAVTMKPGMKSTVKVSQPWAAIPVRRQVASASSGRASARNCSAARPKWDYSATATKYRTSQRSRSKLSFVACDAPILNSRNAYQ
jgi:hypothetical protein